MIDKFQQAVLIIWLLLSSCILSASFNHRPEWSPAFAFFFILGTLYIIANILDENWCDEYEIDSGFKEAHKRYLRAMRGEEEE